MGEPVLSLPEGGRGHRGHRGVSHVGWCFPARLDFSVSIRVIPASSSLEPASQLPRFARKPSALSRRRGKPLIPARPLRPAPPELLCLASRWIPTPAFASLRGRAVLLCSQLSLEDFPPLFFSLEVFSLLWEPSYVLAFLSGPPRGFQRSLRPAVCPRTRQSAGV